MSPQSRYFAFVFMGAAFTGALLDTKHPEVMAILAVACVLWRER